MASEIDERGYADSSVLVSTDWVASNLHSECLRIVESNEDPLLFKSGHLEGAVEVDWVEDLNDPLRRDYIDQSQFSELASRLGLTPETTVVFYGDKNNWWACYALWVFRLFGHDNVRIMDGGRLKWESEGRPLTKELAEPNPTQYQAAPRDDSKLRAFRDEVLEHSLKGNQLVDVRSPEEFSGERLHIPGYPNEGALRGGHIPGAKSIPWAKAVNPDSGEFLEREELAEIYLGQTGFSVDDPTIAYCRIGERSSHTWFVLSYLLGFPNVKNYDGSWTEWGNSVGVPVEK